MNSRFFAQLFIFIGVLFLLLGLIFHLAGQSSWIGRLPGDILFKRKNFVLYFPFMSGLLLSLVLSILFSLFFKR